MYFDEDPKTVRADLYDFDEQMDRLLRSVNRGRATGEPAVRAGGSYRVLARLYLGPEGAGFSEMLRERGRSSLSSSWCGAILQRRTLRFRPTCNKDEGDEYA